jgi:hypothetical protein
MQRRGRKPKGQFTGKLANFSTRIRVETRKALEREATETGQSISQLAERLLVDGLAARRDRKKDRAIRAVCFLISEAAQHVGGYRPDDEKNQMLKKWRTDPFFYRAFRIAISRILEALEPPGEIKPPQIKVELEIDPKAEKRQGFPEFLQSWVDSFKSPEARGKHTADYILTSLARIPQLSDDEIEEQIKHFRAIGSPESMIDEVYGMPNAARDLRVEVSEAMGDTSGFGFVSWHRSADIITQISRKEPK